MALILLKLDFYRNDTHLKEKKKLLKSSQSFFINRMILQLVNLSSSYKFELATEITANSMSYFIGQKADDYKTAWDKVYIYIYIYELRSHIKYTHQLS